MIYSKIGYETESSFWNNFLIISIIFLIIFIVLLIVLNPLKNKYYHTYHDDILFKKYKDTGVLNQIFSTFGETNNYIKRYALRHSSFDTSIITNYVSTYNIIDYYVVSYNNKGKVIDSILITERKNGKSSRIIAVKKNTKKVNIIIKSVDGVEINKNIIKPIPISKIRIYSLLMSLIAFNTMYILSRISIKLAGDPFIRIYNKTAWNFFAFLGMILLSVLIYLVVTVRLRKKNSITRNGGLEYEFY